MYNFFGFVLKKLFTICSLFLFAGGHFYAQSGRATIYSENRPTNKSEEKAASPPNKVRRKVKTDGDIISVETDLVVIPSQIADRRGRPVTGLRKEEFKIFENGVEQEIAYFSDENQPFTVALLLDMSYSSIFKLMEIQTAALAFVDQLRQNDRVMVVSFDEKVRVLCKPTADRKILRLAIEGARIASGTSLYAALDAVLQDELGVVTGRKAIVLLSDGVDTSSPTATAADVLRAAAQRDVLIYPIYYDTYDDVQKSRKESAQVFYDDNDRPYVVESRRVKGEREEDYEKAIEFVKTIADQTGGRVYRVSSTANLNRAFAKIADELRKIYSLGYYPVDEKAVGAEYEIKVRVYRPDLTIRARSSYSRQSAAGK